MKPTSVVPFDSAGGRKLHVRDRLVGSTVEHRGPDALGLVNAVNLLYQGVIVCLLVCACQATMASISGIELLRLSNSVAFTGLQQLYAADFSRRVPFQTP